MALINGTTGDDVLVDTAGNDTLNGFEGTDTITVSGGADSAFGFSGSDRLIIDYASATGNVTSTTPTLNGNGHVGSFANGASSVSYGGIDHFTVLTGAGNDDLRTGSGDDVFASGAGNDIIAAGSGALAADGGTGVDGLVADLSALGAGLTIDLQANTSSGSTAVSIVNIEYLNDLNGGFFVTGTGDDTIVTRAALLDDRVDTGAGNDSVRVAGGIDTVRMGAGDDRLVVDYGSVGGNVSSTTGSITNGFNSSVTFTGVEHFTITTGAGNDNLTTGGGNDVIRANGGNDTLDGGAGEDIAVFSGSAASGIATQSGASLILTRQGVDVLANFEWIQFDGTTPSGDNLIRVVAGDAIVEAADDSATVGETGSLGVPAVQGLLANDVDLDDAMAVVAGTLIGAYGVLTLSANGAYTYSASADHLRAGETVQDVFAYTVLAGGASASATLVVTVHGENDLPSAAAVVLAPLAEDSGARLITQADLLAGASDVDGDTLTASNLAIAAGGGTLADNGDGTWSYTPAADDDSAVSFTFSVTDGTALLANTATLDLAAVNDAPTVAAVALSPALPEDGGARLITQAELLAGAADVEGDALTARELAIASGGGTLVDNGDGTWSYTGGADDDSEVVFSFAVHDGTASVANTATLDIDAANDAPAVAPVVLAPLEEDGGARLITQAELLAGASDVDGDALSASNLAIASGGGALADNGDGSWRYTPGANDDSAVSFSFQVTDGGDAVENSATLDITPVNDAPVAAADAAGVQEDGTTGNLWSALLANDSDADSGDTRTIVAVDTAGTRGTVQFDAASGALRYAADDDAFDALRAGETMTDTFHYTVQDGSGATSTAQVTMTIAGVDNDASGAKLIVGTGGRNLLRGTRGDDEIRGLGGNDTLLGGRGGDDLLLGGAGKDLLFGEKGDDTLDGGAGSDLLFGGKGDDVFVLRKGQAAGDVILDFEAWSRREDDTLVLEGFGDGAYLTRRGWDYTVHYDGGRETFTVFDTRLDAGDVIFL